MAVSFSCQSTPRQPCSLLRYKHLQCGTQRRRNRRRLVGGALDEHMHDLARRARLSLPLLEDRQFVLHGALAQPRYAQADVDGFGKGDRREIIA